MPSHRRRQARPMKAWARNRVFYNAADPTQRNANVNFFADYNNLALIAIAVVSGGLLAWPQIKAGTGGKRVNTAAATQLINKRNAVVVDIRDAADFAKGHLPQAKSAPLADRPTAPAALQRKAAPPSWSARTASARQGPSSVERSRLQ
jgi:hypothetical protein